MRVIDRLYQYLEQKHILHRTFERSCNIANGYLTKQTRGKGTIGSEILEKISDKYIDLSLTWLITGKGSMLLDAFYGDGFQPEDHRLKDEKPAYVTDEKTVRMLRDKISTLENSLADKEKIIRLIEKQLSM
ncbi:MAG: hypothetical protein H0X41_07885 [Chitinophagaceae bacterium]|nr:hypothetical protein [Chitinophagaceae bacterium]